MGMTPKIHERARAPWPPMPAALVGAIVPAVAMIALAVAPLPAAAQATISVPMVERTLEDRWIEAHRVPSLVPWASHSWRVDLPDGTALREGGAAGDTLVFHRHGPTGPTVSLAVSATGGVVGADLEIPDGWP